MKKQYMYIGKSDEGPSGEEKLRELLATSRSRPSGIHLELLLIWQGLLVLAR